MYLTQMYFKITIIMYVKVNDTSVNDSMHHVMHHCQLKIQLMPTVMTEQYIGEY
jgi:hypothetical protein